MIDFLAKKIILIVSAVPDHASSSNSGNLGRQTLCRYDGLDRLAQVTGAVQ